MDFVNIVNLMKVGMVKNAFVLLVITKLMEFVEHVILTQPITRKLVFATMDIMEILTNVINAIAVVENAQVLNLTNV